jgi:hypothetical protein
LDVLGEYRIGLLVVIKDASYLSMTTIFCHPLFSVILERSEGSKKNTVQWSCAQSDFITTHRLEPPKTYALSDRISRIIPAYFLAIYFGVPSDFALINPIKVRPNPEAGTYRIHGKYEAVTERG